MRLRFRFIALDNSAAGSFVDLFNMTNIFRVKVLDNTHLEFTLFNLTNFANSV